MREGERPTVPLQTEFAPDIVPTRLRAMGHDLIRLAKIAAVAPPHPNRPVQMPDLVSLARQMLGERRLRERFFDDDLLGEPMWDVLLDLYVAHQERREISMSSACIAARVPGSTALRWIGTMVAAGLLHRTADGRDNRRVFVSLSPEALARVEQYLAVVWQARCPPER